MYENKQCNNFFFFNFTMRELLDQIVIIFSLGYIFLHNIDPHLFLPHN